MSKKIVWVTLAVLAAVLMAALNVAAPAGVPDLRIFGYSAAALAEWAQNDAAVELAAGPLWRIDTVFPGVMTIVLLMPLGARSPRWLPALIYCAADYAENLILHAYYLQRATMEAPALAGIITPIKWAAAAVAAVMMLMAIRKWWRA